MTMAHVILRRLCGRSVGRNIRFCYNLSYTPTKPLFGSNLKKHLINRLSYNKKQIFPAAHVFCQNFSNFDDKSKKDEGKKVSLFQKFKQMYKEYWYVLIPVHVVTSIGWFGGFYYLAKSGVDIVALMESWHVSEVIINPLRDSSMGYVAVSYALYKIFTPLRYMVTLGGTTVSINYLKEWGYIKPVPSAQQLRSMYVVKKDNLMETVREKTDDLKFKTGQLKEKGDEIIEDIEKGIKVKINDAKEQIKEKKKDLLEDLSKPLKIKPKD